ncbi:hypothetical protein MMC14_006361 [Varicellaria rhodocarpa]|nr:hypothetical protein [Varicellaria rhodocarpa]
MSQQRTHSKKKERDLGDSWGVVDTAEDEDEDVSNSTESGHLRDQDNISRSLLAREQPLVPEQSRQRSTRISANPEVFTEFIMPSIGENAVGESRSTTYGNGYPKQLASEPSRRRKLSRTRIKRSVAPDQTVWISHFTENFLRPVLGWWYDVIGTALGALKTPISYALAAYILFGVLVLLSNLLTTSIYSALSPICRFPGSYYILRLDMCDPGTIQGNPGQSSPVEFDELMNAQSKFEEVLEQSSVGVSLPFEMKRGEAAIRDLRQVVRYSQLRSKEEIVFEFDGFIETARIASLDLQRLNSHVGRSVDIILATARWTTRVLDGIEIDENSRGAITSFFNDKLFAPFQPLKSTVKDALHDQYILHTHIVQEEIARLLEEAQAVLMILQNLDDRLDVIHGIAARDHVITTGSRDEILDLLWTKLGGNKGKLVKLDTQLSLLKNVNQYRRAAFEHVKNTILKLQEMGAELEQLRERVGSVELLRDRANIPLSVHIENIQLGVERLEASRGNARRLADEHVKGRLGQGSGPANDRLIESG